jgi:hypothetical protein
MHTHTHTHTHTHNRARYSARLTCQSRAMLIDAARGLLSGTTNVLTTYDAYEV